MVAGRFTIKVPANLSRGRLVIGVRPDFADAGQSAIAERWSVALLVDVWPLKPNVISLNAADVYYPISMDADTQPRPGSVFTQAQITDALAQKGDALKDELVKPLVVKGQNLVEGQLIDYRVPLPTGGAYPYGGRVRKVISGNDGQQLVLLDMAVTSVYDILLGNGDEKQFVKEGVMPEFVTYRSGEPLPADGSAGLTQIKHAMSARPVIKAALAPPELFTTRCLIGNTTFAITPLFIFGVDVGIDFSAGANAIEYECTATFNKKIVPIPLFGPASGVLKLLLGAGVTLEPIGEVKLKGTADAGNLTSKIYAGASYKKGPYSGVIFLGSGSGSGLDAGVVLAKASLTGEAGAKAVLKAAGKVSLLGSFFGDIGLEAKALVYSEVSTEGANAAAVNKLNKESKTNLKIGAKIAAKTTSDLENFYKELFGKSVGMKLELLKVEYQFDILNTSAKAGYHLGEVNDDGQGAATAEIKPIGSLFKLLGLGNAGSGYASLEGSSVYNDLNTDISYDIKECEASGAITTPLIGCVGDFVCGKVDKPLRLCGGAVKVTDLLAVGTVGDTVNTTGTVRLSGPASVGGVPPKPLTVSVTGSPLVPAKSSFTLLPGSSEPFTAQATCNVKGATRGKITAMAGVDNKDEQNDWLLCQCKPGTKDCDKVWGDPYLVTADGLAYDYIASGDYILQQAYDSNGQPKAGLQVQARFLPGFDVSWMYATAMQVGDDVVEITPAILGSGRSSIGMEVRVNGHYVVPPAQGGSGGSWSDAMRQARALKLPGGGLLFVDAFVQQASTYKPHRLTVLWPQDSEYAGYAVQVSVPDGQSTTPLPLMSLQFIRPSSKPFQERGMMGDNDGDPGNDFMRRNGQVLGKDAALSWTALYALFGGDWLVKPYESLFNDQGLNNKPAFPTSATTLTPEQRAMGEVACAALEGFYKEACIHDVGLTGSADMVRYYYSNTNDLNALAQDLVTPAVDIPVYRLTPGAKMPLSATSTSAPAKPVYRQAVQVSKVAGVGKFLLKLRPPRGATAYFSAGQPGSLQTSLTAEGDLGTAVDVDCNTADPQWAQLAKDWAFSGLVQLWAVDPLSGFAKNLLGEMALSCIKNEIVFSAGGSSSLATDQQGYLWAWGFNKYGELGDGTTTDRFASVKVDLTEVVYVQAGVHSLALDMQGRLWAWGLNFHGALGDGSTTDRLSPGQVDLSALGMAKLVSVQAGAYRSLALDDQGRLWAWGYNAFGALGDGTGTHRLTPVQVDLSALGTAKVVSVQAAGYHSLALDDQGRLWAWGWNFYGELGDGTMTDRWTPVQVDLSALGTAKVLSVQTGSYHSLALDDQGRLWAWGKNYHGELGDGTGGNSRPSPVQVELSALGTAKLVSMQAAGYHSLALDEQGRLWAWGWNSDGELGDGTRTDRWTPVQVDLSALGMAKLVSVHAGGNHSLALDDQGRLWAWGRNDHGALGDGTTTDRLSPVQVLNWPPAP